MGWHSIGSSAGRRSPWSCAIRSSSVRTRIRPRPPSIRNEAAYLTSRLRNKVPRSAPPLHQPRIPALKRVIDLERLVRKLDAGNLPVQFDERGVVTRPLSSNRPEPTAPHLDSTLS